MGRANDLIEGFVGESSFDNPDFLVAVEPFETGDADYIRVCKAAYERH